MRPGGATADVCKGDRLVVMEIRCFGALQRGDQPSLLLTSMGYEVMRLATYRARLVAI